MGRPIQDTQVAREHTRHLAEASCSFHPIKTMSLKGKRGMSCSPGATTTSGPTSTFASITVQVSPLGTNLQLVEDIDFDQGDSLPTQSCDPENHWVPGNAASPPT